MAVRVLPLGSSSHGNSILVEVRGCRVLVDAGLSALELRRRLEAEGVAPSTVSCVLLSHEHADHARGAERFSSRHRVPVVCPAETLEALDLSPRHLAAWHPLEPAQCLDLGPLRIQAFTVPHDAARPLGFVIEGEGVRVGIVTDLGHATTLVNERLKGCHALVVESNHDDRMLLAGPYPWALKQRVGGRMGHLSNAEASMLLAAAVGDDSRVVMLAHLSEKNNTPELARAAAVGALAAAGRRKIDVRVAEMRRPSPPIML